MRISKRLPKTHATTATVGYDGGGCFVEYYADDGGSGFGDAPLIQRWYGSSLECHVRANGPAPRDGWYPLRLEDGPDRTDPGYQLDNL